MGKGMDDGRVHRPSNFIVWSEPTSAEISPCLSSLSLSPFFSLSFFLSRSFSLHYWRCSSLTMAQNISRPIVTANLNKNLSLPLPRDSESKLSPLRASQLCPSGVLRARVLTSILYPIRNSRHNRTAAAAAAAGSSSHLSSYFIIYFFSFSNGFAHLCNTFYLHTRGFFFFFKKRGEKNARAPSNEPNQTPLLLNNF